MWNSELYGNYRNRTFNDVWDNAKDFSDEYEEFNKDMLDSKISRQASDTLFMLLSARYGNSTVASQNEEQFKMKVFTTIFMYGPTWEKRLEIQRNIRSLKVDDVQIGGKAIYNTALNPSQPVAAGEGSAIGEGTNTLEELKYINQQNTTNYMKSKPEAYAILTQLLETDVTAQFLDKFKKLFLTVVSPEVPLWYVTDLKNPEVEDDN